MEIAEKIKSLRKKKDFNQKELAEKSNVSQAAINKIETGKTKNPSVDIAMKIAEALDSDVYDLFGDSVGQTIKGNIELEASLAKEKKSKQTVIINFLMDKLQESYTYKELSLNVSLSEDERNQFKKWSKGVISGLFTMFEMYHEKGIISNDDIEVILNAYPTSQQWNDFCEMFKILITK